MPVNRSLRYIRVRKGHKRLHFRLRLLLYWVISFRIGSLQAMQLYQFHACNLIKVRTKSKFVITRPFSIYYRGSIPSCLGFHDNEKSILYCRAIFWSVTDRQVGNKWQHLVADHFGKQVIIQRLQDKTIYLCQTYRRGSLMMMVGSGSRAASGSYSPSRKLIGYIRRI